ncbi:cytochrome c, partial [Gammaproteobacteria bacterium]|nr:cytochrome c [Gammaproteobacteria bacterium]
MVVTAGIAAVMVSLSSPTDAATPSEVEQEGEYLVAAGNCMSCHTNGDDSPFAGGLEFETPFGTVYSTNITSDPETGIGQWSLEDFTNAMRHGEAPDGTNLYPVFPYTAFAKVSDEDIVAIYTYLKTIAPVSYTPPENDLGFPYSQRWALGLWRWMYHDDNPFEPQPEQSAEWN